MITKDKARLITADVLAALGEVATKHGVTFAYKGGNFTEANLMMRIEAAVVQADGVVTTRTSEDYTNFCGMYGLSPNWLNQKFTSGGLEFEIVGLNTRRSKNPVEAKQTRNGKIYIFKADSIQRLMHGK